MTLPYYEEWRRSFVLPPGDVKTGALLERLRERLPVDVEAHRKGRRCIRLYAESRESIAEAERVVSDVLSSRWSGLDEAAWEVRMRFPQGWEAAQLHAKLLERDAAVICNGKD